MARRLALLALTITILIGVAALGGRQVSAQSYEPTRVSKAVELLEQDQPIYHTQVNGGGYDEGERLAQTWADYITYNLA